MLHRHITPHPRAYTIRPKNRVAGGSAANVAKALAGLLPQASYEVVFAGMVGNDNTAREYQALLLDRLVQPALVACPDQSLPTATCCCLVWVGPGWWWLIALLK